MPEKDGIETIIEIHKEFPNTKIIAMSGGGCKKNMEFLKMAAHSDDRDHRFRLIATSGSDPSRPLMFLAFG